MLWSVGARFGFDGTDWTIRRLEFWHRGHAALYEEDRDTIEAMKKEAGLGR